MPVPGEGFILPFKDTLHHKKLLCTQCQHCCVGVVGGEFESGYLQRHRSPPRLLYNGGGSGIDLRHRLRSVRVASFARNLSAASRRRALTATARQRWKVGEANLQSRSEAKDKLRSNPIARDLKKPRPALQAEALLNGGGSGIRTHGTLTSSLL